MKGKLIIMKNVRNIQVHMDEKWIHTKQQREKEQG